jgi:hypothetical protein
MNHTKQTFVLYLFESYIYIFSNKQLNKNIYLYNVPDAYDHRSHSYIKSTIVAIFNGFKFQISRFEGFKKYYSYSYLKVK